MKRNVYEKDQRFRECNVKKICEKSETGGLVIIHKRVNIVEKDRRVGLQ